MNDTCQIDLNYMKLALEEARSAVLRDEVPVGAVVVDPDGKILSKGSNCPVILSDPTAHAEIVAMRKAAEITGNYRLIGCTLYVTLEPCVMCAGAMVHSRIKRLVYGAEDPKGGGIVSLYRVGSDGRLNHKLEIQGGVLAEESSGLLKDFFRKRRNTAVDK